MKKSKQLIEELESATRAFEGEVETSPLTPAEVARLERARGHPS